MLHNIVSMHPLECEDSMLISENDRSCNSANSPKESEKEFANMNAKCTVTPIAVANEIPKECYQTVNFSLGMQ
jgi:hypothetical protein